MSKLAQEVVQTYESSDEYLEDSPKLEYAERLVNECLANKTPLIEMLSKHPNWDAENYRIHFNADYTREKDLHLAQGSVRRLGDTIYDYFTDGSISAEDYPDLKGFATVLCWYPTYFTQPIDETIVTWMAECLPGNPKIHVGTKPTKVVMRLLRQYGYESLPAEVQHQILSYYSQYADALSPITITRHTVLSVNPVDFLRMSDGNSWHSCHKIPGCNEYPVEDERGFGCYSAGCLSYAYDSTTMIFYTVEPGYEEEELTLSPKTTRQLYFWNDYTFLESRIYPQGNDGNNFLYTQQRAIVEQVLADCLSEPNVWRSVPRDNLTIYSKGLHYPDYDDTSYKSFCLSSKYTEEPKVLRIGANEQHYTCVVCGGHGVYDHSLPVCCSCARSHNEYYVDGEQEYVDEWSWDNEVCFCQDCSMNYFTDNMTWVDSVDRWVCPDCLEEYYIYSEYSEEYFPRDDSIELEGVGWIAEDEQEYYAIPIDDPGRWYLIDDLYEVEDPDTGEIVYSTTERTED